MLELNPLFFSTPLPMCAGPKRLRRQLSALANYALHDQRILDEYGDAGAGEDQKGHSLPGAVR